jgi:hypothetical protein
MLKLRTCVAAVFIDGVTGMCSLKEQLRELQGKDGTEYMGSIMIAFISREGERHLIQLHGRRVGPRRKASTYRGRQHIDKRGHTSMPRTGFEHDYSVQTNKGLTLDHGATMTDGSQSKQHTCS